MIGIKRFNMTIFFFLHIIIMRSDILNDDILRATKKVVVDAGHGGTDPGAINGNVYEKDFNLEVSNYIYNRLKELGVPVYITRDTDETFDRNERVRRILNAFGNSSDVVVLSNHINAGGGDSHCVTNV